MKISSGSSNFVSFTANVKRSYYMKFIIHKKKKQYLIYQILGLIPKT